MRSAIAAQRVGTGRTDADLVQHAPELVRQRARHRDRRAVEGLLETEAGFHRDHEQVEDVGELARDLLLAIVDLAADQHVGVHERRAPQHDDTDDGQEPGEVQQDDHDGDPEHHRHDAEQLQHQHLVDVEVGGIPCHHQLLRDAFPEAGRREAAGDAGEAFEQRSDDALADRRQHLLVAHVLDLVSLEPAQRVADLRALGRHRPHHEHQRGNGAVPSTIAIINGVMSDLDRQDLAEPEEADAGHDE